MEACEIVKGDLAKAAYTVIVALEQEEVAAAEAQRASFGARPAENTS